MTKRRSQGEGSIHQEPNGRWIVRIELDRGPNGKRRRLLRRTATKRQAIETLKALNQDLVAANQPKNRTLAETIGEYMSTRRNSETLALKTRRRDERWRKRFVADYGDVKVHTLAPQDVDKILQDVADGSLSGGNGHAVSRDYVRRARSYLRNALNNDIRLGYLSTNAATLALIPSTRGVTYPKRALTNAQWAELFELATGTTKLAIDLGGRHGLRPQEVRSVQWEGVDLDLATLTILNQFDSLDNFVGPKTQNSTRTIRLHPDTVGLLHQRKEDLAVRKRSQRWTDRDLVICTRYGTAVNKNSHRRSIHAVCGKTKIGKITPYELRHTAITHQIDAGHTVSQVADWAGTSEKMIYNHYRHKIREIISLDPVNHQTGTKPES